jgi:hypothetical protein
MTFAEGMLRLVLGDRRAGPENDANNLAFETWTEPVLLDRSPILIGAEAAVVADRRAVAEGAGTAAGDAATDALRQEPSFADIEAAVALVQAGIAARVVLSSFPSWPGLLWRAYQLAEECDVLILPTVVRPGGLVDIVVTRDSVARE